jgi:NADPH:quinone reductase-like Zn-dependent oxidoreductase
MVLHEAPRSLQAEVAGICTLLGKEISPESQLKPLNQQTIVITGASSGIGLVTARMAAKNGANVVLAARE